MASGAKRKRQQYHQADMEAALEAANNGASVYSLAKKFGIPRTTLIGRIKGHHGEVQGRPSVLTPEDEEALVGYAKYMSDRGFPLTVRVTKALAQQIEIKRAKGRGESPRFKEAGPGKKWWRGFKRRHPDISLRSPDQLDKERALMATPGVIFEYFLMLEDKLTEANAKNKNPHVIYNADETGVDLSAKISKVIVPRGEKRSPSRRVGSRDHVSALVCVSAAGQTVPPMIVFSKGFPGGAYTEGGPANAIYGFSDSGFIDEFLFERWFTKVFLSHCHKERPIVLIVDQHYSHFTLKVLEAAVANNVVILGLPPHCTHFLQPLDVGIFAPLKSKWALTLEVMQAANPHFQVTKRNFAKIFNTVYDHTVTPSLIKSSFQKSGIFPLNEDAIDDRWVKMSAIPGEKFSSATPPPHPSTSASATPPSQPSTSASATPPPQPSTSTSVTPPPQPSTSASATPPPHPSTSASATPPPQPSTSTSVTPPPHPSTSASVTPPPQPSTSTSATPPPQPSTSASATPPPQPSTSASATPPPQPSTSASATPPPHPSTSTSISCPTCLTPCTTCQPLLSPLIQRLVPPELQDILLPVTTPKSSGRKSRKRLTGRVLTHDEIITEIRQKETEKKEKEERKEKRKTELNKKREEKKQKELEKTRKKEERQAEAKRKLEEKEARKRKREEGKLQAQKKKRRENGEEKENQRQPVDDPGSSSKTVVGKRTNAAFSI